MKRYLLFLSISVLAAPVLAETVSVSAMIGRENLYLLEEGEAYNKNDPIVDPTVTIQIREWNNSSWLYTDKTNGTIEQTGRGPKLSFILKKDYRLERDKTYEVLVYLKTRSGRFFAASVRSGILQGNRIEPVFIGANFYSGDTPYYSWPEKGEKVKVRPVFDIPSAKRILKKYSDELVMPDKRGTIIFVDIRKYNDPGDESGAVASFEHRADLNYGVMGSGQHFSGHEGERVRYTISFKSKNGDIYEAAGEATIRQKNSYGMRRLKESELHLKPVSWTRIAGSDKNSPNTRISVRGRATILSKSLKNLKELGYEFGDVQQVRWQLVDEQTGEVIYSHTDSYKHENTVYNFRFYASSLELPRGRNVTFYAVTRAKNGKYLYAERKGLTTGQSIDITAPVVNRGKPKGFTGTLSIPEGKGAYIYDTGNQTDTTGDSKKEVRLYAFANIKEKDFLALAGERSFNPKEYTVRWHVAHPKTGKQYVFAEQKPEKWGDTVSSTLNRMNFKIDSDVNEVTYYVTIYKGSQAIVHGMLTTGDFGRKMKSIPLNKKGKAPYVNPDVKDKYNKESGIQSPNSGTEETTGITTNEPAMSGCVFP